MELVFSSHPVAEAVECIRDSSIISKVGPSGASRVAASLSETGASEKEQQQGQRRGEVELHGDVQCFWSMIENFFPFISVKTLRWVAEVDVIQDGVVVRL